MEIVVDGARDDKITVYFSQQEADVLSDFRNGSIVDSLEEGKFTRFMLVPASAFDIRRSEIDVDHLQRLGIPATGGERFLINEPTARRLASGGNARVQFADELRGNATTEIVLSVGCKPLQ